MLHCFKCGKDLPDNINYCLYCGAELDADIETVVTHRPFDDPDPDPEPAIVEPLPVIPQQKSSGIGKFIFGGLVGAGLVILALVGVGFILFSMQDRQNNANTIANNKNVSVNTPTPSPTPRKATQTPTVTPTENDVHFITKLRGCEIINPEGGSVNLRRYCDTRDCSTDPTTLYIQADPGTHVEATDHQPVLTGRYSWIQVRYDGETLWVSAARLDCEDL